MGKSMNELGLKKGTAEGVDYDNIPEERGGTFAPPVYPADYGLKLPGDLSKVWDVFEDADSKQWVTMIFDDDNPLTITNATDKALVGTNVRSRINNKPRNRGKKGENIMVSDMTYLVRALDPAARPGAGVKDQAKLNEAFIAEMKKHAGKEFVAFQSWTASCDQKRDAYFYVLDAAGQATGATEKQENPDAPGSNRQGCGTRYYLGDWPKDQSGRYYETRQCQCGAVLRPFGQLERFRPVAG